LVSPWAVFLALTLFGQLFDQFCEFSFDCGKRQGGLWLGSQKEADVMGLGQFMAVPANRLPHKPLDPVSIGRISDGPLNRNQESGLLQLRAQGLRVKHPERMVIALLKYLGDFSFRTEANTLWESTGFGHIRAACRRDIMPKAVAVLFGGGA
jgi:hypothetical protein